MKTKRTITVNICDICRRDALWKCDKCDKSYCIIHKDNLYEYHAGVFSAGHGDLNLCSDCDAKLSLKPTKVFLAYLQIKRLREEHDKFQEDFKRRKAEAEHNLARILML